MCAGLVSANALIELVSLARAEVELRRLAEKVASIIRRLYYVSVTIQSAKTKFPSIYSVW